jgi:hypothetical protein
VIARMVKGNQNMSSVCAGHGKLHQRSVGNLHIFEPKMSMIPVGNSIFLILKITQKGGALMYITFDQNFVDLADFKLVDSGHVGNSRIETSPSTQYLFPSSQCQMMMKL